MRFSFWRKKKVEDLYREYIDSLFRYALVHLRSVEEAEDVCSETFLRYFKALEKGTEIKNPKSFLFKICKNLIIDRKREKERHFSLDPGELQLKDPKGNPEKAVSLELEIERVLKVLDALPDDYKDVVIMRYVEEMEIKEIAEVMDKTENSVRILLSRALQRIRELLQE